MDHQIKISNRLINEKSPYLLQHAHNPVDWWPWCEEVFEKARIEDKPIFLSIGYSTCHWCHVMERESFEDDEVAHFLNRNFLCVKVDKEERPDVDTVYMSVCQALTGSGGWPLTILMTADKKPFYAGTYFPKRPRYGSPGLLDLLGAVRQKWTDEREHLLDLGDKIADSVRPQAARAEKEPTIELVMQAKQQLARSFDAKYGGFGREPKFPTPHTLLFLLRAHRLDDDEKALSMALKTLDQMYRGGIFDHIGFGFSRYSTDALWLVPHFEKMLYDNALLVLAYAEAYQATGNELYKTVATKTLDYLLRELRDVDGGFYCAQDADSEGEEGKYYVFTPDELGTVLGDADATVFCRHYGISPEGNFEGRSIPNLLQNADYAQPNARIERMLPKLRDYRGGRMKLHKDDKILTAWNGLMIAALAKAYRAFCDPVYLQAAVKAAEFVREVLTAPDGRLSISYRDGQAKGQGLLDDYAFTCWALLELYEATFDAQYLSEAAFRCTQMLALFWDSEHAGFYLNSTDSEVLLFRPKETYDGAMPSGNAVAAYCLVKMAKLTGDVQLTERADEQMRFLAGAAAAYPAGHCFFMLALQLALYPGKELVCAVQNDDELAAIRPVLQQKYAPQLTILVKNLSSEGALDEVVPFTREYTCQNHRTTFYLCQNNACSQPFHSLEELEMLLQ